MPQWVRYVVIATAAWLLGLAWALSSPIGSNSEICPGWMLPDAAIPRPPCSIAPMSVMMSPNMLPVTMTSNHSGFLTIHMQQASTW